MTNQNADPSAEIVAGRFNNQPVIAADHISFKPERFSLTAITFEAGKEAAYVISLIDRDILPVTVDGNIVFKSQQTVRATIEITETFFDNLVLIAKQQRDLRRLHDETLTQVAQAKENG